VFVPRNGEHVRRRLQEAALALYRERGYDATTAAEIAAAAGVTERTYFRHFPDKREVLFDGEDIFSATLAQAIADVPGDVPPLKVLAQALATMLPLLELNRPFAVPRSELIAAHPALRERELAKVATVQHAATQALTARGIPPRQATLAAQVALAAFTQALNQWVPNPNANFPALLTQAFNDLQALTTNKPRTR
jgi:AcrR family transcriptional regulator